MGRGTTGDERMVEGSASSVEAASNGMSRVLRVACVSGRDAARVQANPAMLLHDDGKREPLAAYRRGERCGKSPVLDKVGLVSTID